MVPPLSATTLGWAGLAANAALSTMQEILPASTAVTLPSTAVSVMLTKISW
jgi:phage tail protein X